MKTDNTPIYLEKWEDFKRISGPEISSTMSSTKPGLKHLSNSSRLGTYHTRHTITYPVKIRKQLKTSWNSKERAGMSFLIVVAFFTIFGLIIFTEMFMANDEQPGLFTMHHSNVGGNGDYEGIKDDFEQNDKYSIVGDQIIHHDNKHADNSNRIPALAWGEVLSAQLEQMLPKYPIGQYAIDGKWQPVNGTNTKFYVFSAYYDRRQGNLIRIIGAAKTRGPVEKIWCRFWYPSKSSTNLTAYFSATVVGKIKIIRENWNLKYSACFILCPIRAPGLGIPSEVSIVHRLWSSPGNLLQIRNTDQDLILSNLTYSKANKVIEKIGICVKPFHYSYNKIIHLLEFIELNVMLGVSHFTFYNHTLGKQANCVLKHYMQNDVQGNSSYTKISSTDFINANTSDILKESRFRVYDNYTVPTFNILPWDLRIQSQKEIRTEGIFAALNDCIYRNMYRSSYLALIDLDEYIIPRRVDTLTEMIRTMKSHSPLKNIGSFSFQNGFFYLQFPDDKLIWQRPSKNRALKSQLVTQRKTTRRAKLHPQKQRSKYICSPQDVVEVGNHFIWEFVSGKGSLNVKSDIAILHHYRVCEFGGDDCIKSPSVIDRSASRFGERLVNRIENIYNYLKTRCNLGNIEMSSQGTVKSAKN